MIKKEISSLCEIKNGFAFKSSDYANDGYRVIRITNVQKGKVVDNDPKFVCAAIADNADGYKLKLNDILISLTGNVGRIGKIESCHLPAVLNQRVGLIRPISKALDKNYLFQYLNSNQFEKEAINNAHGVAQLNLSSKWVENHKIPLPPLDDQIRIAHLLSKVEGLISQRKQHLKQLDELLKSVFLEMFGFRDGTYIQWTIENLASNTEVVSGVTKGKKYKAEELIEVPYMRVANVQDGYFTLEEIKTILVTQREINQYQLKNGDLLLTEGGDPDKLGRGYVWKEQIPNCIHQNHIFRVRIYKQAQINPYYLSALINSRYGKSYFLKSAKQTTGIASINSTQLKNFPTVLPPIELQNQFAGIVEKIEGIKARYQASLAELERLYGVLSQRAFKGELDLSRVILPTDIQQPPKNVPAKVERITVQETLDKISRITSPIDKITETIRKINPIISTPAFQLFQRINEVTNLRSTPQHLNSIQFAPLGETARQLAGFRANLPTMNIDQLNNWSTISPSIANLTRFYQPILDSVKQFEHFTEQDWEKLGVEWAFNDYLDEMGNEPFTIEKCAVFIEDQLYNKDANEPFKLLQHHYEHIKTQIFKALDGGRLIQNYHDQENRVCVFRNKEVEV